ncbi:hypothetical protein BN2476_300127 [Paraburkholderia piptadeniae]|uniref:Uncharacterized protein n=1 Tax=Paraburkholderia piptadeniae TaxID=1701573 RepID=A0A1N7S2R3_9BURK|nr:hypothetical protein BN2476_300127 [Paraburkholderia piptadeniae]
MYSVICTYSRIRVSDCDFDHLKDAAARLDKLGVLNSWQLVEPDRPVRQITGLQMERSDRRPWKELQRKRLKHLSLSCRNLLEAGRHVRGHPQWLRDTWPTSIRGLMMFFEEFEYAEMDFDGYIRR